MNQIAVREPGARSVLLDMSDRYGMEPSAFEATLRATVVPRECSPAQFAAFLLVAKEYKLNPILKEIYAFPSKGGIQPIVGVDGWANLINSHPAFDGMDFEDHFDPAGDLVSITCRMHRKDRSHPVTATEYLAECKRSTDPWRQWPRRMLRHKAMIQAARYAFSFAGIVDPDEAERFAGEIAQDVTSRGQIVPISKRIADAATIGDAIDEPNSSQASPQAHLETDTPASVSPADAGNNSETEVQRETAGKPLPLAQSGDEPRASEQESVTTGSGEAPDRVSESASPTLPDGWSIEYAGALRRAQKKESLSKYATQFWAQYGSWADHKNGPNAQTAIAIYDAFDKNFGNKDAIEALLRELV